MEIHIAVFCVMISCSLVAGYPHLQCRMRVFESGSPDPASSTRSQTLIGIPNLHGSIHLPVIMTGQFLSLAHTEDGGSMLHRTVGVTML
jgi:hypothetical protein